MRNINEIILHCSATPPTRDWGVKEIDRLHRANGWNGCGYHYVVRLDGTIEQGRREEEVGAHCVGHNAHSIGVCYIGGLDGHLNPADTRTPAQRAALRTLCQQLLARYPSATLHGHNEFANKACPCFRVEDL